MTIAYFATKVGLFVGISQPEDSVAARLLLSWGSFPCTASGFLGCGPEERPSVVISGAHVGSFNPIKVSYAVRLPAYLYSVLPMKWGRTCDLLTGTKWRHMYY